MLLGITRRAGTASEIMDSQVNGWDGGSLSSGVVEIGCDLPSVEDNDDFEQIWAWWPSLHFDGRSGGNGRPTRGSHGLDFGITNMLGDGQAGTWSVMTKIQWDLQSGKWPMPTDILWRIIVSGKSEMERRQISSGILGNNSQNFKRRGTFRFSRTI